MGRVGEIRGGGLFLGGGDFAILARKIGKCKNYSIE